MTYFYDDLDLENYFKVISGGDGYEDFSSSASSDLAGDQKLSFFLILVTVM